MERIYPQANRTVCPLGFRSGNTDPHKCTGWLRDSQKFNK
ncbi:Uncharacterised protein [Bacteroides heparinolyticus]|uniref:Uncharacterized protein n=1 Tax=Prevotella heparinolytica TaxID=28113 RepID=A0A449I1Y8_9BACE|nr:Uncharacterised protein [Bacteroides heparinolyticus]